nr:cytochrome P450 [Tanacetum cinerariifolium]
MAAANNILTVETLAPLKNNGLTLEDVAPRFKRKFPYFYYYNVLLIIIIFLICTVTKKALLNKLFTLNVFNWRAPDGSVTRDFIATNDAPFLNGLRQIEDAYGTVRGHYTMTYKYHTKTISGCKPIVIGTQIVQRAEQEGWPPLVFSCFGLSAVSTFTELDCPAAALAAIVLDTDLMGALESRWARPTEPTSTMCSVNGVWGGRWSWRFAPRGRANDDLSSLVSLIVNLSLSEEGLDKWIGPKIHQVWCWWNLESPVSFPSFSITDIALGKIKVNGCSKIAKGVQGIFYIVIWAIWKWSNRLVNAVLEDKEVILEEDSFPLCKTRTFALGDKPHSFFAPEGKPPRRGLNPRPLACGKFAFKSFFFGGIIAIWDSSLFKKVAVSDGDEGFLAIHGKWINLKISCLLVVVYAPQDLVNKSRLWDKIHNMVKCCNSLYVVLGDFNEVRSDNERLGTNFCIRGAKLFNEFIEKSELIDLPMGGRKFTLMNKYGSKLSKIDRILVSQYLTSLWPNSTLTALPRELSEVTGRISDGDEGFLAIHGKWINLKISCLLVVVYAPQDLVNKSRLWDKIHNMVKCCNSLYVVLGDFNEVRSDNERLGTNFCIRGAKLFNEFIEKSELIDLPMGGRKFTLMNKYGSKLSKIDRILVSQYLTSLWPNSTLTALPRELSDHCPSYSI